jgi:transposase-like protein
MDGFFLFIISELTRFQSITAAARTLGVVGQTLFNWVKAHRAGKLTGACGRSRCSAGCCRSAWRATTNTSFAVPALPGAAT